LTDSPNPYRVTPGPRLPDAWPEKLTFDGQIELADYASLLSRRETHLLVALLALLAPITAIVVVVLIYSLLVGKAGFPTFAGLAFVVLLLAICACLVVFVSPTYRGARYLRRHADLLCRARGWFDEHGLTFDDGERWHWFGPGWLSGTRATRCTMTDRGIRVPIDENPLRFLAFSARLFDNYVPELAKRLEQSWRARAASQASTDWMPWKPEHDGTTDRIEFAGNVTIAKPPGTPEVRKKAIAESVTVALWLVMLFVSWRTGNSWVAVFFLLMMLMAIWNTFVYWHQFFHGEKGQTLNQSGWITDRTIAWQWGWRGIKMPLQAITSGDVTNETVVLGSESGFELTIPNDQISDDESWQKLVAVAQRVGRPNQS